MKTTIIAATLTLGLLAGVAEAQSGMTLDAFVTQANRIPMNPTAMLRGDARRLMRESQASIRIVGEEIKAARAAGRTPPACTPDKVSINPRQLLAFMNGIPRERRLRMSVTDGFRAWFASRYPCAS